MLEYAAAVNPAVKSSFPPEFYLAENCFIKELLNTPDDPDLSIAKARVAPGQTTRRIGFEELLSVTTS